jgi:ATP-dependent DNA ligase
VEPERAPARALLPRVAEPLAALPGPPLIVDGEILARGGDGAFDFAVLLSRLHPAASRVERLRRETPASFVAFDLMAADGHDLTRAPFDDRRRRLERVFEGTREPLAITPITDDATVAAGWLEGFAGGGIDGVVANSGSLPYRSGERVMLKVKREHTADCVVSGWRWLESRPAVGSLLLALHDALGALRHVGVVSSFTEAARRRPMDARHGVRLVPLRPERVAEVAYERFDRDRFRHPARFVRWRPDRDARSCTFDQLEVDHRAAATLIA